MVDIIVEEWAPDIWTHSHSNRMIWEGEDGREQAWADAVRVGQIRGFRPVMGLTLTQKNIEKRLGINTAPGKPKPKRVEWYG